MGALGTAAAALVLSALTSPLTGRLTLRLGLTGAAAFAVALTLISGLIEGARWAKDRLATIAITSAFIAALVPLVSLVWIVLQRGSERFGWVFLNTDMTGVYGAMVEGGIYHAIIGTVYVTAIAAAISIPLGILTAIYLVEYGRGPLARAVTVLVDVMTGIPSIVAGLFAFAVFLLVFGPAYKSAVIGGVGLAVLMTPVVVRSVEEMLRLVPNELREAAYALGVPKWLTFIKVVLRTAIAGITTGIMFAIARVIGETAPLLVTVGFASGLNWNAFEAGSRPCRCSSTANRPRGRIDRPRMGRCAHPHRHRHAPQPRRPRGEQILLPSQLIRTRCDTSTRHLRP